MAASEQSPGFPALDPLFPGGRDETHRTPVPAELRPSWSRPGSVVTKVASIYSAPLCAQEVLGVPAESLINSPIVRITNQFYRRAH